MRLSVRLFSSNDSNCLVKITNGLFKTTLAKGNSAENLVFPHPIKSFSIDKRADKITGSSPTTKSTTKPTTKPTSWASSWAITGTGKSQMLNIIAGKYIATPLLSRTYPFMRDGAHYDKIRYLNFRDESGLDKVHLSARYESYSYKGVLEMSEDVNSVYNYVTGANNYNSNSVAAVDRAYANQLIDLFNLSHLAGKWINSLSNGQMRRARIAKALITKPTLLIVDDPFLGLDPDATELVANSLEKISSQFHISLVLGVRLSDAIPPWVENVAVVDHARGLVHSGARPAVLAQLQRELAEHPHLASATGTLESLRQKNRAATIAPIAAESRDSASLVPHIEFRHASVVYKGVPVLANFSWKIHRGTRWRILGNNGTGKTTILSLITADHPQSWKSVILIDGVLRRPGCGVSFFDVNNKVGISSPEIHALVPLHLAFIDVVMSGVAKDVGNSNFLYRVPLASLTAKQQQLLRSFHHMYQPYENTPFGQLPVTFQKLALFLRAIIRAPEILILDEAFSCIDDPEVLVQCHHYVETNMPETTVLAIAHLDWELPRCDYVLRLHGDESRSYDILSYTTPIN